jgi:hypothetical protein
MRRREGLSFHRPGTPVVPRRPGPARFAAALPILVVHLLALGCAHRGPDRGPDPDPAAESSALALQAAVDRLVAIEDIEQLKARFLRCVDTKDLVCLRDEVFAPGAEIHFQGADYDIAAVGWTAIEKFYREAFTPTKFGMHHAHTPEITVDGETARGIWYLHDVFVNLDEGWTLQGSALYDDSYAKIDGEWRIMYSTYERLWEETTPRDPKTKLGSKSVRD